MMTHVVAVFEDDVLRHDLWACCTKWKKLGRKTVFYDELNVSGICVQQLI